MHVGAEDGALDYALRAVAYAVADALGDAGQGGGVAAEFGSAAVVFEAGERLGQAGEQGVGGHLADGALVLGEVVTSKRPTPSTRSPEEVSYQ